MLDVQQLETRILELNKIYYNTGNSEISDEEYDQLKAKLRELKPESVVFNSVGADPNADKQFTHINPMLSLENVFNADDLKRYFATSALPPEAIITMEDKLDGLACSLHYKDGQLDLACTRGNGIVGEIITEQVSFMATVPKQIPMQGNVEIRGEIMMPYSAFDKYNEAALAQGGKTFISARNAAVGSINSKNPRTAAARGCVFVAYSYLSDDFDTHFEAMNVLTSVGFFTTSPKLFPLANIDTMAIAASMRLEDRKQLGIDGIVFKINHVAVQKKLGMNNTSPRWAVAFKQNTEVIDTVIEMVDWQVGRMGALTPVARFTPVVLSDALLSNATLHNWNHIQSLGLSLGDRVLLVRSGGVIPKVNLVLDKAKEPLPLIKPTTCPSCIQPIKDDDGILSCINIHGCPGIQIERLIYASSKLVFDMDGIGPEVISHAFHTQGLRSIPELLSSKAAAMFASRFPATAEQNIPKYLEIIKRASKSTREAAIMALCIPSISKVMAKQLAEGIDHLTDLLMLDQPTLIKLGLTPVRLNNFLKYIRIPANAKLISDLDLVLEFEPRPVRYDQLEGMTFVVTGSFETMSRTEIEKLIYQHGGKVVGKVSARTDVLVLGDGGGSKHDDALKLSIPIMPESEFFDYLKVMGIDAL